MQSVYENELPSSILRSTLDARALRKHRITKTVMILLILFIMGIFVLIILEEYVPLGGTAKVDSAPAIRVTSHDLPPDDTVHRKGYRNNMYLKLLNETHAILNRSNCWLCSHLPHHGETGIKWIVEPFPLPASCFASIAALYYECWINETKFNYSKSSPNPCFANTEWVRNYDVNSLGPLKCSVYFASIHMIRTALLSNIKFEYKDHIPLARHLKDLKGVPLDEMPPIVSYANKPMSAPFCLRRLGKRKMGTSSNCDAMVDFGNFSRGLYVSDSAYFVCGDSAYPWLPQDWEGTCYMAMLLPGIYVLDKAAYAAKVFATVPRPPRTKRVTDDIGGDTASDVAGDVFKAIIPFWGTSVNSIQLRHLSVVMEKLINSTADMISNITFEQKAIRLTALQNRLALDMMLVERGGVCELVGSSCCTYIPDNSASVFEGIERLHKLSTYVHEERGSWDPVGWFVGLWKSWGYKLLMFLLIGVFVVIGICLCINCLPAICSTCVSCCMSAFRVPAISASVTNAMIMQDMAIQSLMNISMEDIGYNPTYTELLPSPVDPYLPMIPVPAYGLA